MKGFLSLAIAGEGCLAIFSRIRCSFLRLFLALWLVTILSNPDSFAQCLRRLGSFWEVEDESLLSNAKARVEELKDMLPSRELQHQVDARV